MILYPNIPNPGNARHSTVRVALLPYYTVYTDIATVPGTRQGTRNNSNSAISAIDDCTRVIALPGSSQPGRTGAKRLFSLSEHAGAKRLHACLVRHSSLPDVHPRPPPFMYVGGAPLPTKLTPSVHCGDGRPRQYCIVGREEVNAQVADTSNAFHVSRFFNFFVLPYGNV